jgi:hypothetical protein
MTATRAPNAPKTLADVTAANPYPSWAREVAADLATGLNVAALRARTADASALAPFDVELRLADGTTLPLPLATVDVAPQRMTLVVRLPRAANADALAALLSKACAVASGQVG